MKYKTSHFVTLLCISFCCPSFGIQIQFYKNKDYTDLLFESSSPTKCNNFPGNRSFPIKSIRTDTCVILYWHPNCVSSISFKKQPGYHSNTRNHNWPLASFHVCKTQEGGSQLNVDITTYYELNKPLQVPEVLESYRDVCRCINIPVYVQQMEKWSINNHGNELMVYFEPDCTAQKHPSYLVRAGHSADSRKMFLFHDTNTKAPLLVRSIGPDRNSAYFKTSCYYVNSISNLTNQITTLEQKLHQTEDNLYRTEEKLQQAETVMVDFYKSVQDIQEARQNESIILTSKFQEIQQSLDDNKRIVDEKLQKQLEDLEDLTDRLNSITTVNRVNLLSYKFSESMNSTNMTISQNSTHQNKIYQ